MAYIVSGTDLTSVANAIRTAGGTSAQLEFPSGFVTAIGNLSGGGGGGGLTNVAAGTFTGTSNGEMTVNISYTGSGYPICVAIFPSDGGSDSSTFGSTVQKLAISSQTYFKKDMTTQPNFSSNNDSKNVGISVVRYKSSDSSATSYTASQNGAYMYGSGNTSAGTHSCMLFSSATTLKVLISDSSNGFMKNVEYKYVILYSS